MVSVCMITYKHEFFIREAIEGVLMQKVNFEVELIIADDCSPDQTQDVVLDYQNNHPRGSWIKYTRHELNKGMVSNFVWALRECRGKYIAICEGDDFWIDKNKLQMQFNLLEKNPKIALCCHNIFVCGDNSRKLKKYKKNYNKNQVLKYTNLLSGEFYVITLTSFFRNSITEESFKVIEQNPIGDFPLWVQLFELGDIYYFSKRMGVYRFNGLGEWSSKQEFLRDKIMFDVVNNKINQTQANAIFLKNNSFLILNNLYKKNIHIFNQLISEKILDKNDNSYLKDYLIFSVKKNIELEVYKRSVFYKFFSFYHKVIKGTRFE